MNISPRYRAILADGDTTRERPLQIFGESIEELERWALKVLKDAPDGAAVSVYQTVEQYVKLIPKPLKKTDEKTEEPSKETKP